MNDTKSPIVGEAGNVAVIVVEVVSTKYPSLTVTLNEEVLTACQAAPPDTVAKDKLPDPSVCNT